MGFFKWLLLGNPIKPGEPRPMPVIPQVRIGRDTGRGPKPLKYPLPQFDEITPRKNLPKHLLPKSLGGSL